MILKVNCIYYVCICLTGVWFVGELLSGIYGIVSAHGLIVANTFIPGSITYLHGSFMVSYTVAIGCKHYIKTYYY